MDGAALERRLIGLCRRRWWLHRWLDPLYARAARKGDLALVREDADRLGDAAQVARLQGRADAEDLAERAMARWQQLADGGDPEAAFRLAEAHRTGFGRPRNHWKALDHYRLALDRGHPEAAGRLQALEAGEPIVDGASEAKARQALLRAVYGEAAGARRARAAAASYRELRREGVGFRMAASLLIGAGALFAYVALDLFFFGLGAWRPDPARVAWGVVGRIHPPRGTGPGRAIPGWLRPDVRSVAFSVEDHIHERSGRFSLGDFRGRVVYLLVVDGRHPAVRECRPFMAHLAQGEDPAVAGFVLMIPSGLPMEDLGSYTQGFQWAFDFAPAIAEGPKGARPLGTLSRFPMNFVIDRQGRIRQRWLGWSEDLTRRAIQEALAE